ncbi:Cdc40p [Kluyveromyces lactis]|uniref:Pre-mRNA-processing factor 17 n=1 Tax=Kluyveromyces lactis (strain ATCC 8585 / CBS 2359 / DSM 70799 / NBRC 1267 / NRRL Y-1140 / WM37) TaxID=284590 RepID=Q6CMD1_KLULA|nr:uncharacterized protein KLLA0_E21187g [Kluyveromyces lactis]CAG99995.1 KLLA0E21187p [Kluyveromyces lactis]|eukprot:XP_454908.1 uncharacterized protein KLLA0_E21187g [Kluyveromyces lactis]
MGLVQGYESESSDDGSSVAVPKRSLKTSKAELKSKRLRRNGKGPWAKWQGSSDDEIEQLSKDSNASNSLDLGGDEDAVASQSLERTKFVGSTEKDYLGRCILHPPVDIPLEFKKEPLSFRCFLPKTKIAEYYGHKNGTTSLRFIPKTGHLLLSGGNDNIIKLWDFYHERELLRTYEGHSMTIKDLNFTDNGHSFASASFDKWVKIWNTEKGIIDKRLRFNSVPNCITFHPKDKNQLVVGLSNSEIRHYDLRLSENHGEVQKYDHHQGSILALKYFPDGKKLISSSEDKTVRIWENRINIPIKQISGTAQHSMPWIDINPQGQSFCTQSMDNTIYTYSMLPKYKRHPNKTFKGHNTTGYGIHFAFSPDGQYIASGDSKGQTFIWDWKTTKLLKKFKPFSNNLPVTCIEWNPQETSKLCCAGNTGKIAILD